MVPHEQRQTIRAGERGHTIRFVGNQESVVHRISARRDDAIGKPLGQIQNALRIGHERSHSWSILSHRTGVPMHEALQALEGQRISGG